MPKPQAQKPEEEVKQEALPPVETQETLATPDQEIDPSFVDPLLDQALPPVEQPEEEIDPAPESLYIEVLHVYQGRRTNEQQILPGVYTVGDPKLYGLADYLVKNGHARLVTRTVNG